MTTIKTWQEHHDQHDCFTPAVYMQIEIDELRAENAKLRASLTAIRQEPSNTMSDGKALKEIIRIARAALGEK